MSGAQTPSSEKQKMAKTTSRNSCRLVRKRQCPCGDEQCLITFEEEEDPLLGPIENVGLNSSSGPEILDSLSTTKDATPSPPYVGQTFETDNEALEYYSNFAQNNGFSVKRERSKGNAEHPLGVHRLDFVCHRAGYPKPRKSENARQRKTKAALCKCQARMVIKKKVLTSGEIRWIVASFSDTHNHEMLDISEIQNLAVPSHRYIPASDRDFILTLAKGGSNLDLIIRVLEMEKGLEPGQWKFTEKDLRNFLESTRYVNRENDGADLLHFFKGKKERKNPDLRFDFTLDVNTKLEHVAWSYRNSLMAYNVFGDVVVFDTTYHLRSYQRTFGVWFGIDNHGRTILFGCVLLLDEKPESLRWAFESFIRLMDGKTPQTIVTDIDIGVKDAIFRVVPNTKHAYSLWHLTSKLTSWFSGALGSQIEKFNAEFLKIYESETKEEFEEQWNQLVNEYKLVSDRHISLLYEHRSHWVQAYLRGCFFGGLLAAGHPLSIKPFFKGYVNPKANLQDFAEQVGFAVDFQTQASEEAARQQNQQEVDIKTCMPMEEQVGAVLSRYAFEMFQKELMMSSQFAVYEDAMGGYLVRHHLKPDGGDIVNNLPEDGVLCSCKGFESSGIICRHILRVLALQNCFSLHEKYLVTRWRHESPLFPKSNGYKFRSQILRPLASIIVQESTVTKDRFDYVQLHLSRLLCHVRRMPTPDDAALEIEPISFLEPIVEIVPPAPSVPRPKRGRPRRIKATETPNSAAETETPNVAAETPTPNVAGETHALSLDLMALDGVLDTKF